MEEAEKTVRPGFAGLGNLRDERAESNKTTETLRGMSSQRPSLGDVMRGIFNVRRQAEGIIMYSERLIRTRRPRHGLGWTED